MLTSLSRNKIMQLYNEKMSGIRSHQKYEYRTLKPVCVKCGAESPRAMQ